MTESRALPAAVLFDLDGTLSQTEPLWMEAEIAASEAHGGTWDHEEAMAHLGHPVWEVGDKIAQSIRAAGQDADAAEITQEILDGVVARVAASGDVLVEGAAEAVALMRRVHLPIALVTMSPMPLVDAVLKHFPPGSFPVIVSGEEDLAPKPAPDPYLAAADRLGVPIADCLILEDSLNGVASAMASGGRVVVMRSPIDVPDAPGRMRLQGFRGFTLDDVADLFGRAAAGAGGARAASGVQTGLLQPGERVTLTDAKGRRHSIVLEPGRKFHTTKGVVLHDDMLGGPEGVVISSALGTQYLVLRPLMGEFTVSMPREAAIVYPKDAAQILMSTDIFPGARVLEAGVGSGALSIAILRAIGPEGSLHSYERRPEFAEVAERNVMSFLGDRPPTWQVSVCDLVEGISDEPIDRAVLDMLAPWECIDAVSERLVPGGVLTCYVATTTQMGRVMDTMRAHEGFTEPQATETIVRDWHAEGLAIRPAHSGSGHTGFLVTARRLAPGVRAPLRKRRPAPGAYGSDYVGPRPRYILEEQNLQA